MKFISDTERTCAKVLDFVVRGDGRGARVQSVKWSVDDQGQKQVAVAGSYVRPASVEEVALWRALCAALRSQVRA